MMVRPTPPPPPRRGRAPAPRAGPGPASRGGWGAAPSRTGRGRGRGLVAGAKKKKAKGKPAGGGGGGGGGPKLKSPGEVASGSAYQTETRKIILSLSKVTKRTPQGKELLKDVSLGMYLGAKIGILGANGAGKSTLMKILAGVDTAFDGELRLEDGIKVGCEYMRPPHREGRRTD